MNLATNPFTQALAAGEKQIGLWVSLSNNFAAEVVAPAGYDWVLLDMEHSPNDLSSVMGQLQAFAPGSTTPIVRPEWNDPVLVKRLLDVGAPGLLFPMVQSVAEAEKAVSATRYPPRDAGVVEGCKVKRPVFAVSAARPAPTPLAASPTISTAWRTKRR